ncbi:growth arrest and DNA damage-inducible protein GADD45 gamma [Manacus vitellinus]|uniref:growth arrest and DNA damage-inducible protein GADD45 gamma n=1 Tax=Manacus vitellinus TaxID=328815 RepID=UPI00115E5482|nr:growth arrest and DNA damage-inducible protein GADD45 gamma [Manacus vitellinus]
MCFLSRGCPNRTHDTAVVPAAGPGECAQSGRRGWPAPAAGLIETPLLSYSDPDNVAFCVLAADQEDEGDIALQIHFTLIQAFCCENDIDIVRVNDVAKLAAIVGPSEESGEPRDLHCILITNPSEEGWKDPALENLNLFCEESRNVNDWVPTITLPE